MFVPNRSIIEQRSGWNSFFVGVIGTFFFWLNIIDIHPTWNWRYSILHIYIVYYVSLPFGFPNYRFYLWGHYAINLICSTVHWRNKSKIPQYFWKWTYHYVFVDPKTVRYLMRILRQTIFMLWFKGILAMHFTDLNLSKKIRWMMIFPPQF
jgi:hypothetical protein